MKILHVLPSLSYNWGGPPQYVAALTEALVKNGIEVHVYSTTDSKTVNRKIEGVRVKLFPKGFLSKLWTSYSLPLARTLAQEIAGFDLIHIHELWNHQNYAAYKAAKLAKIPFVVTIHGQLNDWCLNCKGLRKKIYSSFIQKKILREASGIHAMTENEERKISNFVSCKYTFIVPNGVLKEEFDHIPERTHIEKLYPELKNKIVLLFLGRITPVKGLDILVKAFSVLLKKRKNIHLLICGPKDTEYKNKIIKLLKENDAIGNTTFTGMIMGNKKLAAFSRADIFILPSYSEGFSTSTLEAMACGLPVIITEQCTFLDPEELGFGKIIRSDAGHLAETLGELIDNPGLCKDLGGRARQLVFERYSIDNVAIQMIDKYKKILGKYDYARR